MSALFWTPVALEANRIDHSSSPPGEQAGPTRSSRALAMVHLAMHDAYFAAPGGGHDRYDPAGPAAPAAYDRDAALGAAAARMLRHLYPSQAMRIDDELKMFRAATPGDMASHEFGEMVADRLFLQRQPDLVFADNGHVPSTAPYHHRVDPFHPGQGFLGPHWGGVAPFAVAPMPLQAPPTPAGGNVADAAYYAQEFAEVRDKGRASGSTRTQEESLTGVFWAYDGAPQLGTPPRLYMQIALRVMKGFADRAGTWVDPGDYVRLFAMMATAMADAGIQAWRHKYDKDLWRPVVGIREADASFGPEAVPGGVVEAEPFWAPFGAPRTNDVGTFTPNFPAYPSGHATFGAAAFEVLRRYIRERDPGSAFDDAAVDPIAFDFVSDEFNGKNRDPDGGVRPRHKRHFDSLWQAIVENSLSRVFLGVHWRFDGLSSLGPDGKPCHELPATPGDVGPLGGVRLGLDIARALSPNGTDGLVKPA